MALERKSAKSSLLERDYYQTWQISGAFKDLKVELNYTDLKERKHLHVSISSPVVICP